MRFDNAHLLTNVDVSLFSLFYRIPNFSDRFKVI